MPCSLCPTASRLIVLLRPFSRTKTHVATWYTVRTRLSKLSLVHPLRINVGLLTYLIHTHCFTLDQLNILPSWLVCIAFLFTSKPLSNTNAVLLTTHSLPPTYIVYHIFSTCQKPWQQNTIPSSLLASTTILPHHAQP